MRGYLAVLLLAFPLGGCLDDSWEFTENAVANLSFDRTPVADVPRPQAAACRFEVNGKVYTLRDPDAIWQHLRHMAQLESLMTDISRLETQVKFSQRRAEKIAEDRDAYAANGSTMLENFDQGIYYHEQKAAFLADQHEALRTEYYELWNRIEAHLRKHHDSELDAALRHFGR